jgi:hypothetical protein
MPARITDPDTGHPLAGETLLPIGRVAERFPGITAGETMCRRTPLNWIKVGVRGPNTERIRLEAIRVGSRWITSEEAVTRFLAALKGEPAPERKRSNPKRLERIKAAARRAGIMSPEAA